MKLKALSFTILSALTLTACGGDSSSNDSYSGNGNSNGSTTEKEWYSHETGSSTTNKYLTDKVKFTVDGNKLYTDLIHTVDGSTDIDEYGLLNVYLAEDGLYFPSETKTALGYKLGTLSGFSTTQWTFNPTNLDNRTGLKLTENFKTVDLSGKEIGEYLDPFSYYAGSNANIASNVGSYPAYFLAKVKGKTFPSGSTCLISTSAESNMNHAEIYSSIKATPDQYFFEDDRYITTSLNNYPIYISSYIPTYYGIDALVKIGSDYYTSEYLKKGVNFTLDAQSKEYEQDYKDAVVEYGANSEEAMIEKYFLDALPKQCTLFNKKASDAIDAVS